jgi:hypothetical protein
MVGIANENAIFLNVGWSEPKAGDVTYSFPDLAVR